MSRVHVCYSSDMHPSECEGKGRCVHCDAKRVGRHNPRRCWLCWDGDPAGIAGVFVTLASGRKMRTRAMTVAARRLLREAETLPDIPARADALRAVIRALDLGYLFGESATDAAGSGAPADPQEGP